MSGEYTWGIYKQFATLEQRAKFFTERIATLLDPLNTGTQYYYESWRDGLLKEGKAPVSVFAAKIVISPENYQILYDMLDPVTRSDLSLMSPDTFITLRDWDLNRSKRQRRANSIEEGLYGDIGRYMDKAIKRLEGIIVPEYRVVVPSPIQRHGRFCYIVEDGEYKTSKILRDQLSLKLVVSGLEYSFRRVSTSGYLELAGTTSLLKISGTVFKGNLLDDSYLRMGLNADVFGLSPFPRVSFARRLGTTLFHAFKKTN